MGDKRRWTIHQSTVERLTVSGPGLPRLGDSVSVLACETADAAGEDAQRHHDRAEYAEREWEKAEARVQVLEKALTTAELELCAASRVLVADGSHMTGQLALDAAKTIALALASKGIPEEAT